jgi:hypothetical protein
MGVSVAANPMPDIFHTTAQRLVHGPRRRSGPSTKGQGGGRARPVCDGIGSDVIGQDRQTPITWASSTFILAVIGSDAIVDIYSCGDWPAQKYSFYEGVMKF